MDRKHRNRASTNDHELPSLDFVKLLSGVIESSRCWGWCGCGLRGKSSKIDDARIVIAFATFVSYESYSNLAH